MNRFLGCTEDTGAGPGKWAIQGWLTEPLCLCVCEVNEPPPPVIEPPPIEAPLAEVANNGAEEEEREEDLEATPEAEPEVAVVEDLNGLCDGL